MSLSPEFCYLTERGRMRIATVMFDYSSSLLFFYIITIIQTYQTNNEIRENQSSSYTKYSYFKLK